MSKIQDYSTIYMERRYLRQFINLAMMRPNGKVPKALPQVRSMNNFYVEKLFDDGLIKMGYDEKFDEPGKPQQARNFFVVTPEGYHFQDFLHESFNQFVLKSICAPIVVSIITTLVILAIKHLI